MKKWYFRLRDGGWGYVDASTRRRAVTIIRRERGETPAHIEVA